LQDDRQIALVRVNLDKTINTYFINVADTSVLFITSRFRSRKKERIPGSKSLWQSDKVNSAEISFSHHVGNPDDYFIEWVSTSEDFSLISKNNPGRMYPGAPYL